MIRRRDTGCTVIVPTYNRVDRLRRLLTALEYQDVGAHAFSVVVADDGSTDATSQLLSAVEPSYHFEWVRRENGGPGAARNCALEQVRGGLVLFLDDDVVPPRDLLNGHLRAHRGSDDLVVIGAMRAHAAVRHPWTAWEVLMLERVYSDMLTKKYAPTPRQFFTANASVSAERIARAGGFNETMRRAEDVELAYRLQDGGARFVFRPDLYVEHDPDRPLGAWLRMARQYGNYDVMMWRELKRRHIIDNISEEYAKRRGPLRLAARTLVGRRLAVAAARLALVQAARLAWRARLNRAAMGACSAVFNIEYWHGVSESLGGRRSFWDAIEHPEKVPARSPAAALEIREAEADA
jgi:glycosyltransferase involved in cell wall biosynthesis